MRVERGAHLDALIGSTGQGLDDRLDVAALHGHDQGVGTLAAHLGLDLLAVASFLVDLGFPLPPDYFPGLAYYLGSLSYHQRKPDPRL